MNSFYYLSYCVDHDLDLLVTINGFPLRNGRVYGRITNQAILNEYLVNGRNRLCFQFPGAGDAIGGGNALLDAGIKVFMEGEVVTPEDGRRVQLYPQQGGGESAPILFIQETAQPTSTEDASLCYDFRNDDYDFSARLNGPILSLEEAPLIDYAMYLIGLFERGNVGAFLDQYAAKAKDLAIAYGRPLDEVQSEVVELVMEAMGQGLAHVPGRDEILVRNWCDGRIYELAIKPNLSLINTQEGPEGSVEVPIFVSVIDRRFRIIR